VRIYAKAAGLPERIALGVYDADGTGASFAEAGSVEQRVIAEFKVNEAAWGERNNLDTARSKARVALRTGRNTSDVVRNAPELLQEGDPRNAGGILAEVN